MTANHFIVRKSTLDKRWDAFYSEPEIVALELRVQQKATHTLRDFARFMSGGATPLKSESDQHYTDAANGVPFIRVQNLTTTGELDLQDVKYITHSTNSSSLARSRLSGGELLVKITGVGRMAVASVVPDGFEANINQHIAAIKTDSKAQSEALAAYLNLDFVERLASRRATGGTRPALDYNALLSIPVIDAPRIVSIMQDAYAEKRKLEAQAAALLSSIDDYLLAELGITLPTEPENTIANRIFTVRMREMTGWRLDPQYNNRVSVELQQRLIADKSVQLRSLVCLVTKGETPLWRGDEYQLEGIPFLRAQNISPDGLIGDTLKIDPSVDFRMARSQLFGGEILYTMAGTIGVACIYPENIGRANINQAIAKIVLKTNNNNFKNYLVEVLNSSICRRQALRALTVAAQPNINFEQINSLLIPLPLSDASLVKIVSKCKEIRDESRSLYQQAEAALKFAKQTVESLILGEA